jgi:hypothetical protein
MAVSAVRRLSRLTGVSVLARSGSRRFHFRE